MADSLLGWFEQEVMCAMKGVGELAGRAVCPAGRTLCGARNQLRVRRHGIYQRQREGQTRSLFGDVTLKRPYYLCAKCHRGRCPLDEQLGFCAGGLSSGLSEHAPAGHNRE